MKLLLFLVWLILPISSFASDDWTSTQKTLFGTYVALSAIDAAQTIKGVKEGYTELNPIYGSHPSESRVIVTKVALTTLIGLGINSLPSDSRILPLSMANIFEVYIVGHNKHIGINIGF